MNALRKLLMIAGVAATLFLLAGCGGGGGGDDTAQTPDPSVPPQPGQALQVVSTTPQGEGAELDTEIRVEFSGLLDDSALPTPPLVVRQNGLVIPGSITHDTGDGVLRFQPTNPLVHRALIEVVARAGIMDVDGNEMTADVQVDFMTRLPEAGAKQTFAATPDDDDARIFRMNRFGQGVLVYTDASVNATANVIAVRYDKATGFGAPFTVGSGYRASATADTVHIADNGDILVAFRYETAGQRDAVARMYDAGTDTWTGSTALEISPSAQVVWLKSALSATGDAVFVWSRAPGTSLEADRLYVKSWTPSGAWGATTSIHAGTGQIHRPYVAMSRFGRAVVAWSEDDSDGRRTRACHWTAAASWGTFETVDEQAPADTRVYGAAVDSGGRTTVLFSAGLSETTESMWAVRHELGGMNPGWQTPSQLDSDQGVLGGGQLAGDAAGHVIAAWGHHQGGQSTIRTARYEPGSGWSTRHVFAPTAITFSHGVSLDVASDGTAGIVVHERAPAARRYVYAAVWAPGATAWSPLRRIADERYDGLRPFHARAWQRGNVYVSWVGGDEDANTTAEWIRGRWVDADGPATDIQDLSAAGNDSVRHAGFDIDADGNGLAIWTAFLPGTVTDTDVFFRSFR